MRQGKVPEELYVEGKVELTDITDREMQTGMKGMKKGRAPDIDEMHVEMVRQWNQLDKEAADYMYEAR